MRSAFLGNFMQGAGTVFDIMPSHQNYSIGGHILTTSNRDALHGDWLRVGGEINHVFGEAKADLRAYEQQG